MARFAFLLLLFLSACAGMKEEALGPLNLRPAEFATLPGWQDENFQDFATAFSRSCARILKSDPAKNFGPLPEAGTMALWQERCREFAALDSQNAAMLRTFFESRFRPYEVRAGDEVKGLFTGYYEASLRGSRTRKGPYRIPLYTRPDDLVMVDLGEFRDELKGQRIAGRVVTGQLKPYEDRAAIVAGQWPHNDKVLVWVDDAVDAFFVQVQGSGVVEMDDGSLMRIGYAGQNGHIYTAIGRELIKRQSLSKEDVSMQAIEQWLKAHPEQADEIMNTNRSYVFFKMNEEAEQGPQGGEGVALTPQRSLAVDRSLLPYGLPLWVDIEATDQRLQIKRLMIAQDTGGAIRGPVRGDFFWGHGAQAEAMAGPMKSDGRYWALLPR
ncbi:MAG: murein transglycosylase A [Alphaproteobacteria bacterium]|nr:murein transglycosylase A [Alphaproteobacteria bacterium]